MFGAKAGLKIRAEVSADRIELVKDTLAASRTMRSPTGRRGVPPSFDPLAMRDYVGGLVC